MRRGAAVGVNDDLAAGETTVSLRTTNHNAAGRVHQITGVLQPLGGNDRLDDHLDRCFFDLLVLDFRRMLR